MKKVKQSKKRWAWTEAQKRKHRTCGWTRYGSGVPKWFCREFSQKWKNSCNANLKKVKLGEDPDNLYFYTHNHKNIAKGYWW